MSLSRLFGRVELTDELSFLFAETGAEIAKSPVPAKSKKAA